MTMLAAPNNIKYCMSARSEPSVVADPVLYANHIPTSGPTELLKDCHHTVKKIGFQTGQKLRYLTQKIDAGLIGQDKILRIDLYAAMLRLRLPDHKA